MYLGPQSNALPTQLRVLLGERHRLILSRVPGRDQVVACRQSLLGRG